PRLTPRYVRNADAECALGLDMVAVWPEELLAVATNQSHWEATASIVEIHPPPPHSISLVGRPNQRVPGELDRVVAESLAERRLTLVGALRDDRFVRVLCRTFSLDDDQVRWIEAEPGREPQLEGLRSLAGHRDIVCCILGAPGQLGLGHSGTEKAMRF